MFATPPRTIFPLLGGLAAADPPSLISVNMNLVGHDSWKGVLFSDLKTLEVYTIFGSENLGGLMFDAVLSEVRGAKPPGKAGWFGGPLGTHHY